MEEKQIREYSTKQKEDFEEALKDFNVAAKRFTNTPITSPIEYVKNYLDLRKKGKILDEKARHLALQILELQKYDFKKKEIEVQLKNDYILRLALSLYYEQERSTEEKLAAIPQKTTATLKTPELKTPQEGKAGGQPVGHIGKMHGYIIDDKTGEVVKKKKNEEKNK